MFVLNAADVSSESRHGKASISSGFDSATAGGVPPSSIPASAKSTLFRECVCVYNEKPRIDHPTQKDEMHVGSFFLRHSRLFPRGPSSHSTVRARDDRTSGLIPARSFRNHYRCQEVSPNPPFYPLRLTRTQQYSPLDSQFVLECTPTLLPQESRHRVLECLVSLPLLSRNRSFFSRFADRREGGARPRERRRG